MASAVGIAEGRKKLTRGRQKIEMKLIENEDDRLITFSKRRSGIYKKASELSTLCGAEVAVVVFSPAGKPFSFGHPSIESVTRKVLSQNPPMLSDSTHPLVEAHRKLRIGELNYQHNKLVCKLDSEKERGKCLQQRKDLRGNSQGWWEAPIEDLRLEELRQLNRSLAGLYGTVGFQLKGRGVMEVALPSYTPPPSFSSINGGLEVNPFTATATSTVPLLVFPQP